MPSTPHRPQPGWSLWQRQPMRRARGSRPGAAGPAPSGAAQVKDPPQAACRHRPAMPLGPMRKADRRTPRSRAQARGPLSRALSARVAAYPTHWYASPRGRSARRPSRSNTPGGTCAERSRRTWVRHSPRAGGTGRSQSRSTQAGRARAACARRSRRAASPPSQAPPAPARRQVTRQRRPRARTIPSGSSPGNRSRRTSAMASGGSARAQARASSQVAWVRGTK